jgi:hypothetical protein
MNEKVNDFIILHQNFKLKFKYIHYRAHWNKNFPILLMDCQ